MKTISRKRQTQRGFTLIEIIIVIGIMGILMAVSYPSIMNTLASRNLDNSTRQVQTYLQQTKLRAVDTKIVHRVRFYQADGGYWVYE
ncbi:MAG: prepilin-type N-terminal cleavage/methylation domain-containing protein, partial [Candidatus Aminicenantes bacterium]